MEGEKKTVADRIPALVKAKPRSCRVRVGSGLSSCGKCCLCPQVLVVGHEAAKCSLSVLHQHLCRQPAPLLDLQDSLMVLLGSQHRGSGK